MAEDKRRFGQIMSHCGVNDARLRSSEVTKLDVDKVAFLTPSQIFHLFISYCQGAVPVTQEAEYSEAFFGESLV